MTCGPDELARVSAWEIRLLLDASEGLSYADMARKRGKTPKAIEKSFERLREKLRPWGGGTKPGLVHWIDTHYDAWMAANAPQHEVISIEGVFSPLTATSPEQ